MSADPFESPKILVDAAREEIAEIVSAMEAFFLDSKAQTGIRRDEKAGDHVVFLSLPQPPNRLRKQASGVLNDLRHALDQACYAASKQLGRTRLDHTYFPFAASEADFPHLFQKKGGRCRDIHDDIRPYLKALEPWWRPALGDSGNNLLRSIGYVTGGNKHRVILSTGLSADSLHLKSISGGSMSFPWTWNEELHQLEIARTDDPSKLLIEGMTTKLCMTFGNVKGIGGAPVETVLTKALSMTEGIVLGLEAETARLLAAKGGNP